MTTIQSRIQHKRDTSSNWEQNNPVILAGEIIIVDTNAGERRTKTGDGVKRYNELPFDDEIIRNLVSSKDAETLQSAKEYTDEKFTNIDASDIEFTDGQTFQQKYDSGQLTGPAGKDGIDGQPGKDGTPGSDGQDGAAATITVGTVTTGKPGSQAKVVNAGTSNAAVLNFTIPRGATGATGNPGADGKAATIQIGSVTTGAAGSNVSVTNSGNSSNAILNFTIPKGDKGDKGDTGNTGPQGPAGDSSLFIVNITQSGSTYSADKTYSQIQQAVNSNKKVIFCSESLTADGVAGHGIIANTFKTSTNVFQGYALGGSTTHLGTGYSTVRILMIAISSSNSVDVTGYQVLAANTEYPSPDLFAPRLMIFTMAFSGPVPSGALVGVYE